MSDTRLIASAKKNRYQLQFCPHPNVLPYRHLFQTDPAVHILDERLSYQQVFAESDLILTDYSSTAFDFAYLKKPIIYSQFDRQAFFSGQIYSRGYFDYEKDGFGEVETTYDGTVDRLIEYMENGCQMKPKYTNRVDSFFAFNDQKNCERVYQRIRELLDQT